MKNTIINKITITRLSLTIFMAIALLSCTRDDDGSITETGRYAYDDVKSYKDLFTVFWNVMDNEYNYFYEEKERTDLDWDNVYAEYLTKFEALKSMDDLENFSNNQILKDANIAKNYFEEIVNKISDQHFALQILLPASRTENFVATFRAGSKEEAPLYYSKSTTMDAMRYYKLDKPLWKNNGSVKVVGGNLQSNPDIYYFSFDTFSMNSLDIDLSSPDSFLFNDVRSEGLITRSELERNEDLNTIENSDLKEYVKKLTIEAYDAWNEAFTKTLQSEILSREVKVFNDTEEITDALYNEALRLFYLTYELPLSVEQELDDRYDNRMSTPLDISLMHDENALNYIRDFDNKIENMKTSYNYTTFQNNLYLILDNADIYRSFYNPLHNGDIKKLILDLRGNGGGSVIDARLFLERLVSEQALVGYQRTKEGNGRFNYTPWVPMYTKPHPFAIPNPIPIVVLTDYGSVSMSELSTLTLKSQKLVKSVGDYTRGGTAGLGPSDEFNGGAADIIVANHMWFYMPLMATKDATGKVIEGIGVKPDAYIAPPTEEEIENMEVNPEHKDRTLEKGIDVINNM